MVSQLKTIIAGALVSSEQVSEASSDISRGNQDLADRTEQQASALEEISASVEEINSSIKSFILVAGKYINSLSYLTVA